MLTLFFFHINTVNAKDLTPEQIDEMAKAYTRRLSKKSLHTLQKHKKMNDIKEHSGDIDHELENKNRIMSRKMRSRSDTQTPYPTPYFQICLKSLIIEDGIVWDKPKSNTSQFWSTILFSSTGYFLTGGLGFLIGGALGLMIDDAPSQKVKNAVALRINQAPDILIDIKYKNESIFPIQTINNVTGEVDLTVHGNNKCITTNVSQKTKHEKIGIHIYDDDADEKEGAKQSMAIFDIDIVKICNNNEKSDRFDNNNLSLDVSFTCTNWN